MLVELVARPHCIFIWHFSTFKLTEDSIQVIVIDLFNETVLFNHRGGRSPPRLLNRQSS